MQGLGKAESAMTYSVDEHRNLLQQVRNKAVVRLHPVSLEEEVTVDVEVAAVIFGNLSAQSFHDGGFVEIFTDPAKFRVTQVSRILALSANIVNILASTLVGTDHCVVAVNGGRNTAPSTFAFIASFDETQAAGEGVVHSLAFAGRQNCRCVTFATSHRSVVVVLRQAVGETITDHDSLEVDVPVLVGKDLIGKDGDVMSGVRFSSDVEILLGIFRELLEEESHKSIDIFAGGDCVAHT